MLEQAWTETPSPAVEAPTTEQPGRPSVILWFLGGLRLLLINLFSLVFFNFGILTGNPTHYALSTIVITFMTLFSLLTVSRFSIDNRLAHFYLNLPTSIGKLYLIIPTSINIALALNAIWRLYQQPNTHTIALVILLLFSLGLECFLPLKLQEAMHRMVFIFGTAAIHEAQQVKFNPSSQVLITTGIVLAVLAFLFGIVRIFNAFITSALSFFLT